MTITDEMALRAARAEAAFARREYDAMSRLDRERYLARARAALTAALEGREEPDATAAYMAGFERGKEAQLADLSFASMMRMQAEAATAEERERCARVAEEFGPSRPLAERRPAERVMGRWEGEQAASQAIAAAIRGGG